jgi:hypothetical protein
VTVAGLSLPFLATVAYRRTWRRMRRAIGPGGRIAAMLFGDRGEERNDPSMTCAWVAAIRGHLAGFELEHWSEKEEDGQTALGEPHHFRLIDLVAVRSHGPGDGSAPGVTRTRR